MKKLITILFLLLTCAAFTQVTIQDTTSIDATLLQIDNKPIGVIFSAEVNPIEPAFYHKINITDTLKWSKIPDSLFVRKEDIMNFISKEEVDSLINIAIKNKFSLLCEDL